MLWPPLLLFLLWAGCLAQDPIFKLDLPNSVIMVQEGLCVLVPCRVSYPNSSVDTVFGYWFRKGANAHVDSPVATNNPKKQVQEVTKGRFHLLGDPQKNNCSLLITDAQKNDTGVYFFRVQGGSVRYSYLQDQLSVSVMRLTLAPVIHGPVTLETGYPNKLTCSVPWACEQAIPPIFSWVSTTLMDPPLLDPRATLSSVLMFTVQPQEYTIDLTCQVTFPGAGVTVERTTQLNVTTLPRVPKTPPSGKSGNLSEVVLVAIGETAVKVLLLGIGIIFLSIRCCRKKTVKPVAHRDYANVYMD